MTIKSHPTNSSAAQSKTGTHSGYRRMGGLTIIQLMIILLIAGVLGRVGVDYFIARRCASPNAGTSCVKESDKAQAAVSRSSEAADATPARQP